MIHSDQAKLGQSDKDIGYIDRDIGHSDRDIGHNCFFVVLSLIFSHITIPKNECKRVLSTSIPNSIYSILTFIS